MNAIDLVLPLEFAEQGVCGQVDPELFFPDRGGLPDYAKRICAGCPVRRECLEWALDNDERFGVWGGYSEQERRWLRRAGMSRVVDVG